MRHNLAVTTDRPTVQRSWQRSNTAAATDEISLRSWEHLRHLVIWSDPAINLPSADRRNRGNIPVAGIYPHRDIQAYTRQTQTDSDRHESARHWQSFGLFGQSTVVFHELFYYISYYNRPDLSWQVKIISNDCPTKRSVSPTPQLKLKCKAHAHLISNPINFIAPLLEQWMDCTLNV